jgi:hypothetical protein
LACLAGTALAGGLDGSGIVVLDRSADGALNMVGNSDVEIPARAVYVNSSSATAVRTQGNARLNCPNLYVCGGTSFSGNSGCSGVISHPPVPYDDPCSNVVFPSSSGMTTYSSGSVSGGTVTFQPGYYSHGISITGNANVTFAPGVYLVANGFKITAGSMSGAGVCFVIQSGSVSIAGASSLVLTPPASGNMQGLVFAQPSSNTSAASLAGGSAVDISGAMYAPGALLTLTGSSQVQGQGPYMGDIVIAKTVKLAGNGLVKIGHPQMQAITLPSFPLYD